MYWLSAWAESTTSRAGATITISRSGVWKGRAARPPTVDLPNSPSKARAVQSAGASGAADSGLPGGRVH